MREHRNPSIASGVLVAAIAATIAIAVSLLCLTAPASARAEGCPNEARRAEQGELARALPDCRAYELVTLPGSEPEAVYAHTTPVSVNGDRIGYFTQFGPPAGLADPALGPYYLSSRGPGGWTTVDEVPPQSTISGLFCSATIAAYSADLSRAVLADGWNWTGYPKSPDENGSTTSCGHDEPLLDPGEGQGAQNIFLHETNAPNEAGSYELLNPTPPGQGARNAYFQAGSADLSHVVFTSPLQLTPDAPVPPEQTATNSVGEDLYESAGGTIHLVTVLPGGAPDWGILANGWESDEAQTSAAFTHAVSDDGERVYFYGGGEQYCETPLGGAAGTRCGSRQGVYLNANLYLREKAAQQPGAGGECSPIDPSHACTVQVDKPNFDAPAGPGGGGTFQWATPDGSRAFFTDCARLTADSTAVDSGGCGGFGLTENGYEPPRGNDLYEFDAARPAGERLTDLTVDPNGTDPLGADVQGVAGISADGSYVYFVARGVLTGGEENANHEAATAGQTNLYLRHAGATTFIATLGPPLVGETRHPGVKEQIEACDWASAKTPEWQPFVINPLGQPFPCLTSRVSADGRFLAFDSHRSLTGYDNTVAETGEPSFEIFRYDASTGQLSCASCDPSGAPPTAARTVEQPSILPPLLTGEQWGFGTQVLSSQLSDDGKVFFTTADPLLPADVNGGHADVYEYDGGGLHLISAGTGEDESFLRNASPSGDDVFFTTADALLGSDTDNATSIYDARVGGGFPEPPPTVTCESEEACHTAHQAPPASSAPATARFQGPGNELRCPKGKVAKKGRCVARKPHRHKKRHHRRHRRAAHLNNGGQK